MAFLISLPLMLLTLCASALAATLDINTADAAALETLPGIGESKAAAIIQYRADNGPFKSVEELDNVSGIGESTMASIRPLVSVGPGTGGTGSATASPVPSASPAGACAATVNINTADASALQNLPGIGESKAAAILQYRADNGPYSSCDGLDNVSGIGAATLSTLAPCCTVK